MLKAILLKVVFTLFAAAFICAISAVVVPEGALKLYDALMETLFATIIWFGLSGQVAQNASEFGTLAIMYMAVFVPILMLFRIIERSEQRMQRNRFLS